MEIKKYCMQLLKVQTFQVQYNEDQKANIIQDEAFMSTLVYLKKEKKKKQNEKYCISLWFLLFYLF